jgi:hypothetical protein
VKSFLATLKKYAVLMAFGALVGIALCAWLAPRGLQWWDSPVVNKAFSCEQDVRWATERLVAIEGYGALIAAIVTAIGGAVASRFLKARAARKQAAGPSTPPAG